MFECLAAEVRDLQVPLDGPAIVELHAIADQLHAVLHEAIGEFDARSLWDLDAAVSMRAWLRDRAALTDRQAGREVAVARQLHDLPVVSTAWRSGTLSSGQIDAIAAIIPARHRALFAEHEAALVPDLASLDIDGTTRLLNHWVAHADADLDQPEADPEPTRSVHLSPTLDGRGRLDGNLDPDLHATVRAALRVAETTDVEGEPVRTPAERRADALGDVARFYLDHQTTKPDGRHRPHLNVILDTDHGTARYADGPNVSRPVLDALLCDSTIHRLLRDSRGAIIDYGIATRVVTAALWMAVALRDQHCRFHSCDRPAAWCDAHHVIWFSHGGETNTANLVLLCRKHHRRLHQPGWHTKLLPDGTFEVTDPEGLIRTSHPPGTLRPPG